LILNLLDRKIKWTNVEPIGMHVGGPAFWGGRVMPQESKDKHYVSIMRLKYAWINITRRLQEI
jgi:hypothetical protein